MEIKTLHPQTSVSIRRTVPPDQLGVVMGQMYGEIMHYLEQQNIQPVGPPFARYYSFADDAIEFEAGLPVATPAAGEGDISASELPGGEVASAIHMGHYDKLNETYTALETWIKEQGREIVGASWDIYWTDPTTAPEHEWKTEVIWPVR